MAMLLGDVGGTNARLAIARNGTIDPASVNWAEIFKGAEWFHFTGITPALSDAAAEAALEAADRAADAAATAASGAVAPVAQAVQDAAQAANDAAAATDQDATAAVAATRIQSLLTPEGFDAAQVARIIDDAALGDAQKATLKRLVETARSNPDLLRQALDQVKAVMP